MKIGIRLDLNKKIRGFFSDTIYRLDKKSEAASQNTQNFIANIKPDIALLELTLVEEDKMDCKIINGTVVTATDTYRAEVGIVGEKVVQIAKKVQGTAEKVVDAKGCYVMPGGIDIHTHLDMPFGGTVSSDDFETGTMAAVNFFKDLSAKSGSVPKIIDLDGSPGVKEVSAELLTKLSE